MSYQVLARQWRPQNFDQMLGQEHVVKSLVHALEHDRLHHAYLFTGTRGVGKTTVARVLAKCLNCEAGVSATPCEQCDACQQITQGRFVDLIEVDAASRTKVEDTRELLDNVQYLPAQGRFKVYLIDEVHMLSGHSFNALLKTLEEPPAHVKFLLATTDPQKLPVTVLSRCLQFHLKSLSPTKIQQHLSHILEQQQIPFEPDALWQLARAAQGSVRDGLSLLDQAISFSQGQVSAHDVHQMLGTLERSCLLQLLSALLAKQGPELLALSGQLAEQSADFEQVLAELITALHHMALLKEVGEIVETVPEAEQLLQLAQQCGAEDLQLFYQIALHGRRDLPLAPDPRHGFEMVMLRMLAFFPGQPRATAAVTEAVPAAIPEAVLAAVDDSSLSLAVKTQPVKEVITAVEPIAVIQQPEETPVDTAVVATSETVVAPSPPVIAAEPELVSDRLSMIAEQWLQILPELGIGGITATLASNCVVKTQQQGQLQLAVSPKHAALYSKAQEGFLAQALSTYCGSEVTVTISIEALQQQTPAEQQQQQHQEKKAEALQNLEQDANIQAMRTTFMAEIDEKSLEIVGE